MTHRLVLYFFFTISLLLSGTAAANSIYTITNKDKLSLEKSFYYIDKNKLDLARFEAAKAPEGDILKLVLWLQYQEKYEHNDYQEISDFVKQNPDWPKIKRLRNIAEEALDDDTPSESILSYFKGDKPITGHAMRLLAEAKIATGGDENEINQLLRQSWIQGDFKTSEEKQFLEDHNTRLRVEDHIKRIDRLLWENKVTIAKRIINRVDRKHKRLFIGRIALIQNKKNVDHAINKISPELRQDPGFLYERIKWNYTRKNYKRVYEFFSKIKSTMPYQEKWWKLKNQLIRELLEEKKFSSAYNIAKNHGNTPGGTDYAESEWLAGWISLVFLNLPRGSYEHFYNMYDNVDFPVSRARGAYWAARAAEENNNLDIANKWYRIASKHFTTFYGQLAYIKIYPDEPVQLPDVPPSGLSLKSNQNSLIKAAYLLSAVEKHDLSKEFIIAAIQKAESPSEMAVISELGHSIGRSDLSVIAAKHALRRNVILSNAGWPVINNMPRSEAEKPLVLGIIRQESSFNKHAKSPAEAMGLMQLIPSTAKLMSKKLRLRYNKNKLMSDPEYNITLGSHYIGRLIDNFDGSYLLAIAAYNAGPTNVKKWIKTYGDPRKISSPEDVLNWIESIPFAETRNYIQRVLENTQIYRHITRGVSFALNSDLTRVNTQLSEKEASNNL